MRPLDGELFAGLPPVALVIGASVAAVATFANLFSPGCTGPVRQTCDFFSVADRAFPHEPELPVQLVDAGSSVIVQQPGLPGWIMERPSVLVDRRSCRVCDVGDYGWGWEPDATYRRPPDLIATYPPADRQAFRRWLSEAEANHAGDEETLRELARVPRF